MKFSKNLNSTKHPGRYEMDRDNRDNRENYCSYCAGTGEGMRPETNCWHCLGSGIEPKREEAAAAEADTFNDARLLEDGQ